MFSFNFIENNRHEESNITDDNISYEWYQAISQSLPRFPSSSVKDVVQSSLINQEYTEFEVEGIRFRKCIEGTTGIHGRKIDAVSDLIPGIYGGGMKIWECTIDLMQYLIKNKAHLIPPSTDLQVLELGCGHGYPGITAMLLGYRTVTFSDLNVEVIHSVTWPNIVLNCQNIIAQSNCECRCVAGDWLALANRTKQR